MSARGRREVLRDILAGSISAGLLTACEQGEAFPAIQGRLLGPHVERAHRLRKPPPQQWPDFSESVDIAIVGAGAAGMAAAWSLSKSPTGRVALIDLEEEPGGTARGVTEGASQPYPWGAHYLPVPLATNPKLIELLEEVGAIVGRDDYGEPIGAEQRLVRAPAERVFDRGRWYEGLFRETGATARDREQLARFERTLAGFSATRGADGRQAFAVPVHRSSRDPKWLALDEQRADAWLDAHGFRSDRLRWLVNYACRDEFGLEATRTSAWAMLWYFAARLHPRTGKGRPFLAWPEGNSALIRHMFNQSRQSLSYHAKTLARAIRPGEQRVEVLLQDAEERFRTLRARQVVLAVPSFVAERMLPTGNALAKPSYGPWVVANLHLSERPKSHGFPQAWDNVLYDSPSLGYVDAGFQRGDDHGPTVWTYYFALTQGDPKQERAALLEAKFEHWSEIIIRDLERAHPNLRRCIERVDIWRWGHAMAQPRPGTIRSALSRDDPRITPGVLHAHSDRSAIATFEEAFDHGVTAAEAARAELERST